MDATLAQRRPDTIARRNQEPAEGDRRGSRLPGQAPSRRHQLQGSESVYNFGVPEEPSLTGCVGNETRRAIGAAQGEGVPLVSNWKNPVRDQSVHEERGLYAQVRGLQRSLIPK